MLPHRGECTKNTGQKTSQLFLLEFCSPPGLMCRADDDVESEGNNTCSSVWTICSIKIILNGWCKDDVNCYLQEAKGVTVPPHAGLSKEGTGKKLVFYFCSPNRGLEGMGVVTRLSFVSLGPEYSDI